MFDIGWVEMMVVAIVAILVIGPRELPEALRAFGRVVGRLRRTTREVQSTINTALRDTDAAAGIDDIRKTARTISGGNPLANIGNSIASSSIASEGTSPQTPSQAGKATQMAGATPQDEARMAAGTKAQPAAAPKPEKESEKEPQKASLEAARTKPELPPGKSPEAVPEPVTASQAGATSGPADRPGPASPSSAAHRDTTQPSLTAMRAKDA